MKLPTPGPAYDSRLIAEAFKRIEDALAQRVKSGDTIELAFNSSLILRSSDKKRWKVTISPTGVLTTTAL